MKNIFKLNFLLIKYRFTLIMGNDNLVTIIFDKFIINQ